MDGGSGGQDRRMLFDVTKQLEHGTTNPIVARLTVQPLEILNHCKIAKAHQEKFIEVSTGELAKRLLRCWEIKQGLCKEAERCRAEFKPPAPGEPAVEIPQIPRLREECEDFLYQAKNYLRDLLKLVNLLWGTQYEDASEWVKGKGGRPSLKDFIVGKFGEKHVNVTFIRQYPACIEPFALMRDAVEHPKSAQLVLKNFTRDGRALREPVWSLEKNGKVEYGPLPIIDDMDVAVRNLVVLAEDMLVMWAQVNLVAPEASEVRAIPETRRNPASPVKYRIRPTDALMATIVKREAVAIGTVPLPRRG
jgi:hypothetical protein